MILWEGGHGSSIGSQLCSVESSLGNILGFPLVQGRTLGFGMTCGVGRLLLS